MTGCRQAGRRPPPRGPGTARAAAGRGGAEKGAAHRVSSRCGALMLRCCTHRPWSSSQGAKKGACWPARSRHDTEESAAGETRPAAPLVRTQYVSTSPFPFAATFPRYSSTCVPASSMNFAAAADTWIRVGTPVDSIRLAVFTWIVGLDNAAHRWRA